MKKITALLCIIFTIAIFASSCGLFSDGYGERHGNSLRNPNSISERHNANIVMVYSGFWWGPTARYPMPTSRNLEAMRAVGMNEFVIITGPPALSYYDDDDVNHPIITQEDIDNVEAWKTSAARYPEGDHRREQRHQYLKGVMTSQLIRHMDSNFLLMNVNQVARYQIATAERILEHIPDAKLWFTFPTTSIYSLALNFYEPYINHLYNYIKAHFEGDVWDNNVMGFYFADEEVSYYMMHFDYENEVDFANPMVRLMLQLSRHVHDDDKMMLWMPFAAPRGLSANPDGTSHPRVTRIGHIANRTDIFDFVLMQPNHLFYHHTDMNLTAAYLSSRANTVMDSAGNIIAGEKTSSTTIGIIVELEEDQFRSGNPRAAHPMTPEETKARFRNYLEYYREMALSGNYSWAFYASDIRGMHGQYNWPRLIMFFDENAEYPGN